MMQCWCGSRDDRTNRRKNGKSFLSFGKTIGKKLKASAAAPIAADKAEKSKEKGKSQEYFGGDSTVFLSADDDEDDSDKKEG